MGDPFGQSAAVRRSCGFRLNLRFELLKEFLHRNKVNTYRLRSSCVKRKILIVLLHDNADTMQNGTRGAWLGRSGSCKTRPH
jgi:hypothetical protein